MPVRRIFSYFLLASLVIVNFLVDHSLVKNLCQLFARRPPPLSQYTWLEDDMPERYPLTNVRRNMVMSVEESVRYGVHEAEASLEWLWTATREDQGNIHIGPNHRFGVLGHTHQLHCMRAMRAVLDSVDGPLKGHDLHHSEHCLSFMRQSTLCAADITLEPGDAFARNFTAERVTGDMKCMDVEAFYANMWDQWVLWRDVQKQALL